MLIYILLSLLVVSISVYLWRQRNLPPGPWGLPLLGYLPWLDPKVPYVTLTNLAKKYGSVYGLSLGSIYTVVITDPKIIKTVFAKDVATGRAPLYLTHGIMKGYGLICAERELWKDQRKFIHNCLRNFGGSKIGPQRTKMESLIMEHVMDFIKYVEHEKPAKAFDPLEALRHSLGSTVNKIVFGKSWPREDETWKWLQELQEKGTQLIGVAGPLNFLPFLRFVPKFKQTMNFLLDGKHETHKVYQKIIDEQAECLTQIDGENTSNIIQAFLIEREKRKNSEDLEKFYNDQQLLHLLADIFGAGLDTTLTTLRWFFLYLCKHKATQEQIRQEIKEALQDRLPSLEDISSLPLVEAAIAETQRIRSVVPVGIPHGSLQNMKINGFEIPKGTMIVPLQWAIHMDEKAWPNPEHFDPGRFISDEGRFFKPNNFIPFQTGKRMCVGDELARMLLVLFCTTILQKFSLDFEDADAVDLQGDCGITLTPKSHNIIFTKDS